jgi:hypothetical protein
VRVQSCFLISLSLSLSDCHAISSSVQGALPEIFYFFQEYLPTLSGRFTTKQFTDRINALLAIWTDWAIFPTAFINGLEAMLNQTESEIQPFLSSLPSSHELEEDLFALKRHAKFHGISSNIEIYVEKFGSHLPPVPDSHDREEGERGEHRTRNYRDSETGTGQERQEKFILCRLLGCIKQYVKNKENPISSVEVPEEEDELDGVPVDDPTQVEEVTAGGSVGGVPLVEISLIGKRDGWVEVSAETEAEEDVDGIPLDGDDEDGVDGVPLEADLDGVPLIAEDDDVDGVPLEDDVDGVPFDDDEEIDGVPL